MLFLSPVSRNKQNPSELSIIPPRTREALTGAAFRKKQNLVKS
jgi:hypothetical protein